MANNKFVYLRNEQSGNDGFKKTRGFKKEEIKEEEEERPKIIVPSQKERLRSANLLVYSQRKVRRERKTLDIPSSVDLIRIYFFTVFNQDLQKKFLLYGLEVLEYTDFNKTVLFEITDETLFKSFVTHVEQAYESAEDETYEGKPYNLIALINTFEFINTRKRYGTITERGPLLSLISSATKPAVVQNELLLQYLENEKINFHFDQNYPEIIGLVSATKEQIRTIGRNFDIVKLITSSRSVKLRPGAYGELRRTYGFTSTVPADIQTVGIIDTGVSNIDPLSPLFANIHFDHTGNGINWDESGHGTLVAGLVAFGEDFIKEIKNSYSAKEKISIIKAIHSENDEINIPRLLNDIRTARRNHGIRLFNMSLNIPSIKKYNDSFSAFAYELDKLSYEEDVLIIMSVGNTDAIELERLLNNDYDPSHDYPTFFYDLTSSSSHHSCWFTNIQEPAESMNNLSVGALAGNIEGDNNHDVTPASEYPAYYSRKFHYDFTQRVNGTLLKRNQTNKNLNKPDLVYEGGDMFDYKSGIEILRSPQAEGEKYFGRSCGTSLATPLITSLAAEILNTYPSFRMQTVKALLINSASSPCGDEPTDFSGYGVPLLKMLIGSGKPVRDNLIYTDENSAVFVIEDNIAFDELQVMPLYLPGYIGKSGNKLKFTITLCYNFFPLQENHLSYLPLHISFGLFKPVDSQTIGTSDAKDYRIKSTISWSEDFHGVENRLFSNCQRRSFNLQPYDIVGVNNAVSIAVRCTGKKEIAENHSNHLQNSTHPFSLVVRVTEIPEAKASGQLYSELMAVNKIENIGEAEGEGIVEVS